MAPLDEERCLRILACIGLVQASNLRRRVGPVQIQRVRETADARAAEAFQVYDPNGSPNYIPLTIIVTLVEDSGGNVRIGWHGNEGATGSQWLMKYVQDAIYYYQENVDNWS